MKPQWEHSSSVKWTALSVNWNAFSVNWNALSVNWPLVYGFRSGVVKLNSPSWARLLDQVVVGRVVTG